VKIDTRALSNLGFLRNKLLSRGEKTTERQKSGRAHSSHYGTRKEIKSKDDRFYDDSTHDARMIKRRGRMRVRSRDMTIISKRESTQVKDLLQVFFL
jgi:hypothetical protein